VFKNVVDRDANHNTVDNLFGIGMGNIPGASKSSARARSSQLAARLQEGLKHLRWAIAQMWIAQKLSTIQSLALSVQPIIAKWLPSGDGIPHTE
jgi:hypothetical protein